METIIWHNPRCSKSRQTLQLLEENGVAPTVVHYLESPPDVEALKSALGMLGLDARGLMRRKEAAYRELGLGEVSSEQALLEAMVAHPVLIERPVVIRGGRAAVGRPPENVLELL